MKRIALILALASVGFVWLASAEVVRKTTSATPLTNANVVAQADVYGILRRAVVTVTGGTSTVNVADSDGTALFATNGLTGSYTWTGTEYTSRSTVTITNSTRSISNVASAVTILWTVEQ